jgi:hypothetical protein
LLPEHEEYIPQEALLAAQGTAIYGIGFVSRVTNSNELATSPVFQKKIKKSIFLNFVSTNWKVTAL